MLPFKQFKVGKQCNRYQRVKFPKEIASAQMKNITVTQPKIIKHLQDKDIPYLNKERQRLSKPGQPVFLTLGFFPWTNGWVSN